MVKVVWFHTFGIFTAEAAGMTHDLRRPNIYVISCLAALAMVAALAIATLGHRTYIDVNSARLKRQWEAGPIPILSTREVVDTGFSRLVAESREAHESRPPVWKPAGAHFAFLSIFPHDRYGRAVVDLNLMAILLDDLDPSPEERNELVSRALDLLRDGHIQALHEFVRGLDERVNPEASGILAGDD